MRGWIGVDLDGTLAMSVEGNRQLGLHHIGEPIPAMVNRVKKWHREGREIRIFTARAALGPEVQLLIEGWCLKHLGFIPRITNEKDFAMIELWDDRAVRVVENTGQVCCIIEK